MQIALEIYERAKKNLPKNDKITISLTLKGIYQVITDILEFSKDKIIMNFFHKFKKLLIS